MTDDRIRESHHIWLRAAARDQRRRATPTEQCLWSVLRGRQIDGLRFRRQHPNGPYVVDFLCFEARLVVEIDGSSHGDRGEYDAERDDYLEHLGYRVLRVPVALVQRNLTEALRMIRTSCMAPPLPRAGEGGGG